MMKQIFFPLGLLLFPLMAFAQVAEDIQIHAAFTSMIDLRIDQNSSVSWAIDTREKYEEGHWLANRPVAFSVSASVNFNIDFSNTPFVDGQGNELDIRNLAYRLMPGNNAVKAEYNNRYKWATPDGGGAGQAISGIYVASFSAKTILIPGPAGNAGNFDRNRFIIRVGIGSSNIRSITGLPNLMSQNIAPGTYRTTLSLTAYAAP